MTWRKPRRSSLTTGSSTTRSGLRPITKLPITPTSRGESITTAHETGSTGPATWGIIWTILVIAQSQAELMIKSKYGASGSSSMKSIAT